MAQNDKIQLFEDKSIGANAVMAVIEAIDGVERTEKVIEAETTVVDITLVDEFLK